MGAEVSAPIEYYIQALEKLDNGEMAHSYGQESIRLQGIEQGYVGALRRATEEEDVGTIGAKD